MGFEMRAEARDVARRTREVLLSRMIASDIKLTDTEQIQVRAAVSETRPKGSLIAEEGDSRRLCYLISGWALRQTFVADGKRQISGFLIPGDPLEPFSCIGEVVSSGIVAITPVELLDIAKITNFRGMQLLPVMERFGAIVAREHLRYYRNQMVRLGGHSAAQRLAHLLLELQERLSSVGLVNQGLFEFPLTQEMLADALGLHVVHVNRTMKQLRDAGLVYQKDDFLHIVKQKELEALAEYAGLIE
jgi:CRP-like cAMP-binding protein